MLVDIGVVAWTPHGMQSRHMILARHHFASAHKTSQQPRRWSHFLHLSKPTNSCIQPKMSSPSIPCYEVQKDLKASNVTQHEPLIQATSSPPKPLRLLLSPFPNFQTILCAPRQATAQRTHNSLSHYNPIHKSPVLYLVYVVQGKSHDMIR